MTALIGFGLTILPLCQPYQPDGWLVWALWAGVALMLGSVISG